MDEPMKINENEANVIYKLNGNQQGIFSVPKHLNNNIKVFMFFCDNKLEYSDQNKLISSIQSISSTLNKDEDNGICIISFVDSDFLKNQNVVGFGNQFIKTKKLVNTIYNYLLKDGNVQKENFIKKVELISFDNNYTAFIDWLCSQNPSKFHSFDYQSLFVQKNNTNIQKGVFINNNEASIFNEPTKQSAMTASQTGIKPITQSLSIGNPKFENNYNPSNNQYSGYNNQAINQKQLVRIPPNNHGSSAFIKWYNVLLILGLSLVIGTVIACSLII